MTYVKNNQFKQVEQHICQLRSFGQADLETMMGISG